MSLGSVKDKECLLENCANQSQSILQFITHCMSRYSLLYTCQEITKISHSPKKLKVLRRLNIRI